MKKVIIFASVLALSISVTACGKSEEEKMYERMDKAIAEKAAQRDLESEKTDYFKWLMIEEFEIKRDNPSNDRAYAKLTNMHSEKTLKGSFSLVVYDKNDNIIDTQYVSLPNVGLKPDETFIMDEIIHDENYYSVKIADANMVRGY
ncbi:hypothetical protein ACFOLF_06275 [Paenibacillus sepulcri]|uniref:Lipoprotein n=1 Tax=Paenibacillus sepulcri TaxID=359917 RepID=A0ABS7BZ91_9BACL|nr:hypothetical protein [Paenibacillus sepulcri]